MYSGSINEKLSYKSLIKTIEILNSRDDLIWIICGDGPKKSYLLKKLSNYNNVIFYDFQPYSTLPDWLSIADIHLIPQKLSSVKFCLPSKLLLENHGIRLSNEDPKKMAESLFNLLENKKLRIDLGRSSQNYIKNFHEKDKILGNFYLKVKQICNKS